MIVVHNNNKPAELSKPIMSSIVDDSGKSKQYSTKYGAYAKSSAVTWSDPTSIVESATEDVSFLQDTRMDVVNRARTSDICIASPTSNLTKYVAETGELNLLIDSEFGNWRKYSINGFTTISNRVQLRLKDPPKVGASMKWNKSSSGDAILKSGAISAVTKTIQKANEIANGIGSVVGALTGKKTAQYPTASYFSRWQNAPVVDMEKPPTCNPVTTSLTFEFKFGQAGIFSAEEEVVKPILALANIYLPYSKNKFGTEIAPYPTVNLVKGRAVAALLGLLTGNSEGQSLANMFSDGIKDDASSNLLTKANQFTSNLYKVIDTVASKAYSTAATLTILTGGNVQGPFFVGGVKWEFDFNDVDEFGYPCSGTITYEGLEPILINTSGDIIRQWGYSTGTVSDKNLTDAVQANVQEEEPAEKIGGTSTPVEQEWG